MALSFKEFQASRKAVTQKIVESTIEPHHESIADNWDHHGEVSAETKDKMHSAFGGKDFTHFPLSGTHESDVDPDVGEHLANHGYDVKDYRAGIASKKTMVGNPAKGIPHQEKIVHEKIGSVLDKTGAPDHVKKAYMNDPSRTSFKAGALSGGHHVVISTHPYALAGASTGTDWTSCMNMNGGENTHKLEDDSKHGTHVAYLVHHDDKTAFKTGLPSKPIARLMLKAHHEGGANDTNSDTIYRQEGKSYGSGSDTFHKGVNEWATKHYPAKGDIDYHMNDDLYNDATTGKYRALSVHSVQEKLDNRQAIFNGKPTSLDHDVVNHAVNHALKIHSDNPDNGYHAISAVLNIPNLNSNHVAKLVHATKDSDLIDSIARTHGDKLSTNAIETHYGYGVGSGKEVPNRVLMNPKLPEKVVDSLHPKDYSQLLHSKIKEHHIDKLVDMSHTDYDINVAPHTDRMSHAQLSRLIDDNKYLAKNPNTGLLVGNKNIPAAAIINAKNFSKEHHDKLTHAIGIQMKLFGDNMDIRSKRISILMDSKHTTIDDGKHLGDKDETYGKIMRNPHISKETAVGLKNKMMDSLKNDKGPNYGAARYTIGGFTQNSSNQTYIPERIGNHLTTDDYHAIAKAGKIPDFEHQPHGAKLLDAYHTVAKEHDKAMDAHIEHGKQKTDEHGDDYFEEDDATAKPLRDAFHKHMARYAEALEDHQNAHVRDGYSIKNHAAHDLIGTHLDKIDNLDHYATGNNSGHDNEHHEEHFDEVSSMHRDLEKYRND